MTQDPNAGVFAPAPGTPAQQTPAVDMQGNQVPARTFGPIQASPAPMQQPQQPQQDTNALLSQLLAALAQQTQQGTANAVPAGPAAPVTLSPEDQRLINALAAVHTSGRDTKIVKRSTIGGGLYFVKYSYSPATGVPQTTHALVYDDGTAAHVFGGLG